jgi:hypothetical protein
MDGINSFQFLFCGRHLMLLADAKVFQFAHGHVLLLPL